MSISKKRRKERAGIALIWSVFAIMVVTVSTYITFSLSQSANKMAETNRATFTAQTLSQGATESAIQEIEDALKKGADVPESGSFKYEALEATYTIAQIGDKEVEVDPTTSLKATVCYFGIDCKAEVDGSEFTTRRIIRASMIFAFQFALFMENDLIVYAQAPMTVSGPVHVNGNMYFHTWEDLIFDTNYVATAGDISFSPPFAEWTDYSAWTENPEIRRWVNEPENPFEPAEFASLGYESGFAGHDWNGDGDYEGMWDTKPFAPYVLDQFSQPDSYLDGEGSTLTTSEHGNGRLSLPGQDEVDMFIAETEGDWAWHEGTEVYVEVPAGTGTHKKGAYHADADLSIISYEDGTWKAFSNNGVDITSLVSSAVTADTLFDTYQAADSGDPDGEIQNTIIDLGALEDAGYFPANGLLYAAGYGAGTGLDVKGFQLSNGAELADDLTVISPNSVYIQGDYNVTNKQSASIMSDSLSVLSNSWDNDNGHDQSSTAIASDTTYNVSIVTGDVAPTADAWAIVGNLLRRHEQWSGYEEQFHGSMVTHGYSRYATALPFTNWDGGPGYTPPTRNWSFDTDLSEAENQPPFTPRIVVLSDAVFW